MSFISKSFIKLVFLLALTSQSAWAQLSVSPKRVIFEGRERAQELLLINTGNKTKKYRIGFKQLKMNTAGGYETAVNSDDSLFASDAVRFSPRQVTLEPGQSQTVRLLVRKPKNFVDGEYRSHLTFSEIPSDDDQFGVPKNDAPQGFAFRMRPLLGISIPIIVRQGKLSQAVSIKKPTIGGNVVNLELHREGQASVYGEIKVDFKPQGAGQEVTLGVVKGVSVLPPLDWRKVTVPLSEQIKNLGEGELHITYSNLEVKSAGKMPILSEQVIKL